MLRKWPGRFLIVEAVVFYHDSASAHRRDERAEQRLDTAVTGGLAEVAAR